MKNPGIYVLILQLILLIYVVGCSEAPNSDYPEPKTEVFKNHQPVSKALIGEYTTVPGSLNPGTVTITEKSIFINLKDYKNHLLYGQYSTLSKVDCYFIITLDNGTEIKISDFVVELGLIHLFIDDKKIATLEIDTIPTPETPVFN